MPQEYMEKQMKNQRNNQGLNNNASSGVSGMQYSIDSDATKSISPEVMRTKFYYNMSKSIEKTISTQSADENVPLTIRNSNNTHES